MIHFKKTIGYTGDMFTREHEKIKHHKNKVRELREETVASAFKAGEAKVTVYFEETGEEIELDVFSPEEMIRKYLGKKFLSSAR